MLSADGCLLDLPLPIPVGGVVVGHFLQGLDQDAAQAIAAVQVHADELEADFVDAGAAEKNFATNFLYSQRNLDVGFGADAEVVAARAHTASETHFTHDD